MPTCRQPARLLRRLRLGGGYFEAIRADPSPVAATDPEITPPEYACSPLPARSGPTSHRREHAMRRIQEPGRSAVTSAGGPPPRARGTPGTEHDGPARRSSPTGRGPASRSPAGHRTSGELTVSSPTWRPALRSSSRPLTSARRLPPPLRVTRATGVAYYRTFGLERPFGSRL